MLMMMSKEEASHNGSFLFFIIFRGGSCCSSINHMKNMDFFSPSVSSHYSSVSVWREEEKPISHSSIPFQGSS